MLILHGGKWVVPRQDTKTRVEWQRYLSASGLRAFTESQEITGDGASS